jgi:hypothetical protein
MWRSVQVIAYDVMDEVHVHARLWQDLKTSGQSPMLEASATFAGKGEEDPADWLRDALVALLEEL